MTAAIPELEMRRGPADTFAMAMTLAGPAVPTGPTRTRALAYEAGSQARRMNGWRAPAQTPNQGVLGNLASLRDRSRQAARNDGYADGAIDKLVTNLVGTGIKPLSQAVDPEFRKAVHRLWLRWTDESDADGLLDFYGQQTQAVRCWVEAGEVFVRQRPRLETDGLTVPLQLQVLEPEMCPYNHTTFAPNGNRIRAGIEFDKIGRRVAYWFFASRPGDLQDYDVTDLRRVPAEFVTHLYDPLRAGQLRGIPQLTQALVKLWELDKFDDATLLRQQLANLFVGFVKRGPQVEGEETVNPLTGVAREDATDRPALSLEPGIFQELDHGEEVDWSDPPDAGQGYEPFMRQQLFAVATAVKVPYEVLTGDMSRVNDRTVRVILNEFRRRIQAKQHQIIAFQLCRKIWRAWMDRAFLAGALPIPMAYLEDPAPWLDVRWVPQGWPYLHPVQDVQAKEKAIRSGLTSRSAEVSEHGEDAETIDATQAADNARADALGLKYDSDGRTAAKAAPPAPPARDPEDPEDTQERQ